MKINEIAVFNDDYAEMHNIGDEYTFKEFMRDCSQGYLIDYDGSATLCYDKQCIDNISISIDYGKVRIRTKEKTKYMTIKSFYYKYVKEDEANFSILWFNH